MPHLFWGDKNGKKVSDDKKNQISQTHTSLSACRGVFAGIDHGTVGCDEVF